MVCCTRLKTVNLMALGPERKNTMDDLTMKLFQRYAQYSDGAGKSNPLEELPDDIGESQSEMDQLLADLPDDIGDFRATTKPLDDMSDREAAKALVEFSRMIVRGYLSLSSMNLPDDIGEPQQTAHTTI